MATASKTAADQEARKAAAKAAAANVRAKKAAKAEEDKKAEEAKAAAEEPVAEEPAEAAPVAEAPAEEKEPAKKARSSSKKVEAANPEAAIESAEREQSKEDPIGLEDDREDSKNRKAVTAETAEKFEKDTKQEDEFLRRTIVLPSKKRVKSVFKQEEIIGDEDGDVITDTRKRELEYQLLSDSAKADKPKILTGRMVGVERVEIPGGGYTYEAKVSLICDPHDPKVRAQMKNHNEEGSMYSIYIPAPMFFFYHNPEDYEGPQGERNLYNNMSSRVGSIVDFVVYKVAPDDMRVIGSRIRAMQLKSAQYYLNERTRKIAPGSVCKANITMVGYRGVLAEICGAECFIPNSELSHLFITAASDVFDVGDVTAAVVEEIETDKTQIYGRSYSFVRIKASIKKAQKSPYEKYAASYNVGSKYDGVVVARMITGNYFVRLNNQVEVLCPPPQYNTARPKQKVSVVITDKTPQGLRGAFAYLGK